MAVNTGVGDLFKKYGKEAKKAHDKVKKQETKSGNAQLPAGIEDGVARLVDMKFDKVEAGKDNAGQMYFLARAVVVSPTKFKGRQTSVIESMWATPNRSRKTFDDHLGFVENLLRLLGKETSEMEGPEDLDAAIQELLEEKPYIAFRTWKLKKQVIAKNSAGKWAVFDEDDQGRRTPSRTVKTVFPTEEAAVKANPYAGRDPQVNHEWLGLAEWTEEEEDPTEGTEDDTEDEAPPPAKGKSKAPPKAVDEDEDEEEDKDEEEDEEENEDKDDGEDGEDEDEEDSDEEGEGDEGEPDLDDLAKKANKKDEDAITELTTIAVDLGIPEKTIDKIKKWEDLVKLIRQKQDEKAEEEEDEDKEEEDTDDDGDKEEEEKVITKGEIHFYRPLVADPKDKSGKKKIKAKKPVEVEVTKADPKKKTATVKTLDDGKEYKDVPWSELEEGE